VHTGGQPARGELRIRSLAAVTDYDSRGASVTIKIGTILQHPTLGPFKVTGTESTKVHGVTEGGRKHILTLAFVEKSCAELPADALGPDSPLVTPQRPAASPRTGHTSAFRSRPCSHCGKPLNRSFYSSDGRLKSCPNCSSDPSRTQHVFYAHPADFGTSDARASDPTPDGVQSHCRACRVGEEGRGGIMCDSVVQ
jgi:hypothetical protein